MLEETVSRLTCSNKWQVRASVTCAAVNLPDLRSLESQTVLLRDLRQLGLRYWMLR